METEEVVDITTETIKEELDVFIPLTSLTLLDGSTRNLPKISWKKEKVIFKQVGDLFSSVKELDSISLTTISGNEIVKLLAIMLQKAPDVITSIVEVITDLSNEEVEEQLDSEIIVQLLAPFFSGKIQRLMEALNQTLTS